MIKIIAGGKKHTGWAATAIAEYQKRMKKPYIYDWIFCDESKLAAKVLEQPAQAYIILLDEAGTEVDSSKLYKVLQDQILANRPITIVIGGAFGHFPDSITARANLRLSLSQMTFPHQICRLILAEQLYRAQQIALGHPYHHA